MSAVGKREGTREEQPETREEQLARLRAAFASDPEYVRSHIVTAKVAEPDLCCGCGAPTSGGDREANGSWFAACADCMALSNGDFAETLDRIVHELSGSPRGRSFPPSACVKCAGHGDVVGENADPEREGMCSNCWDYAKGPNSALASALGPTKPAPIGAPPKRTRILTVAEILAECGLR